MKEYKQRYGRIFEDGVVIAEINPISCSRKMRDKIAKYAIEKLNCEERGKEAARQYKERK